MNSEETKEELAMAVQEANKAGARLKAICEFLEISVRTMQRWMKQPKADQRKGSPRVVHRKFSDEERSLVIKTASEPEFRDLYPHEIVAKLAEQGQYIGSESTFYRILKAMRLLAHRRKSKAPVHREKPRLKASGPNQVLSWDISYLKGPVAGMYFYLYLVVDIWSRKIVTWEIHERESADYAASMLHTLDSKRSIRGINLHSDNGSPMKGLSMLAMMQHLGVLPSHSRPRVSTDNPYSESLFGTLKYQASYPSFFGSIEEARAWVDEFANYYNNRHLHSGISYVTPEQRHTGQDVQILEARRKTYKEARRKHPERWSGKPKNWKRKKYVYINPIVEDVKENIA